MSSATAGNIVYNVDVKTNEFVAGMQKVDKGLDNLGKGFDKADKAGEGFSFGLSKIAQALAALATVDALTRMQQLSEQFTVMQARINRFSGGVAQGAKNYEALLAISSKTGSDMGTAVKTWESLTGALKDMGKSNTDILGLTDTLMKMGVVGGSSAEEMKNGLRQLAQSFSGGIIRGEEFNSVLENTPEIARQLAKGLGIPFSDLRKQMLDSKLTSDVVFEALRKRTAEIDKDFANMPRTVAQAANAITNEFGNALSKLDQQSGFSVTLAKAIDLVASKIANFAGDAESLSDALDMISGAASSFAAVMAGRVLTSLGVAAAAQIVAIKNTMALVGPQAAAAESALVLARAEFESALATSKAATARASAAVGMPTYTALLNAAAIAEERTTLAATNLGAAMTASASSVSVASVAMNGLKSAMAFLGGPTGVILLAAYALYEFSKASRETKVNVDQLKGSLDKLTFSQLTKASNDAGDDVEKLNKRLSSSMQEMTSSSKGFWESDVDFAKRKTAMAAEADGIRQQITARKDLQAQIKSQQDQMSKDQINASDPSKPAAHKTTPEDQKVLDNLKEQLTLAKLTGDARARMAAIQKLGTSATQAEKDEAAGLAAQIYALENAKKEGRKADSEAAKEKKKDDREELKNAEENKKAIDDYAVSIGLAAMKGEDLARAQAQGKLNKFATPQDVQTMDGLAKALFKVEQAEKNRQLLAQMDPMAAESQGFAEEMKNLELLNAEKLLSNERFLELKAQAETAHLANMAALQEENFRAQSAGNEVMMSAFDALGASGAQAISGILSGTMSLQDALGNIANTVFNTVIGSFTQMGMEWVKQEIIKRTATKATEAAQVAGMGAVATAQAGTTAAMAATTTTTAAATGTAVAGSMAPAAGLSSIASFGGAAVIGGSALLATMLLAKSFGGGRKYGGGVNADQMYQVNEGGAPEIFNATNGKQYMMPNTRGEVVSNADATKGGGGGSTEVHIHNYTGANVTQTSKQMDSKQVIEIIVGDIANGGPTGRAVNDITGTKRPGN